MNLWGIFIPIIYYLLPQYSARLLLMAVTLVVVVVDYLRLHINGIKEGFIVFFGSFLRRHEFSRLSGATYLLLGCLITSLVCRKPIVVAACAFIIVGDTFASILGQNVKSPKLFRKKTVLGSLGFLLSCLGVAVAVHFLPDSLPLATLVVGAVAATIIEALPLPLDDNFVVPIISGLIMTFL